MGSLSLLQGIFPTQESNPGLPHYRPDSEPAEPPRKPKNTEVGSLSLLHLPDPGIEPGSPALQADFLSAELPKEKGCPRKKKRLGLP